MWYDDILGTVGEFAEGAWESVSTGAQESLGEWASGWGKEEVSPAANVNSGKDANTVNQTATGANQNPQAGSQPMAGQFMGIDTKTMMIGGGVLLAAVLLLR